MNVAALHAQGVKGHLRIASRSDGRRWAIDVTPYPLRQRRLGTPGRTSSTATIERSWDTSSVSAVAPGRQNGPWRRPAFIASALCGLRRGAVVRSDNGLCSRAGASEQLFETTGSPKSSSPPYAGAERDDRALLPQSEGRMRLAAQLPELRRGQTGHQLLDRNTTTRNSPIRAWVT